MKAVPFAAREARRLQAWKLHQQGWSQRAIAGLLEVNAAAVSRCFKRMRWASSVKALHQRKAPGTTPLLPRRCWRKMRALLRRGAEAHGFQGALWTRERVPASACRRLPLGSPATRPCPEPPFGGT